MSPLTEYNLETQFPANMAEWLRSWFDGNWHAIVGGDESDDAVEFPRAEIAFGQGIAPVLSGRVEGEPQAEIRLVVQPGASERMGYSHETRLVVDKALLLFQIRASGGGAGQAEYRVTVIAQLLHAILNNPAAWGDLPKNGISHFFPRRPAVLPQASFAMRVVACEAQLRYTIKLSETATTETP
jgi:hypothetical protein